MNKNRYRIIYNKARQMFMAVAENAKSQSKASGQSSGSTTATTSADDESFHQLWHVKALVASMSMWMPLSTVYAGMVADTGAPAANRPVIGVGQNSQKQNVPVINIQTPNKSGVSHNIYKEFDVPTQGAVLNNSRTGAASSIVGSVGANPYLQTGEARLILNEVNSARASQFEGNLEIAGQRADLIIANPSGINVKGGGFINANRATLTTGKPQFNADGSIKQFVIDQGKITISANTGSQFGLGGANNNANYLDIYTRALELNAQLHAEQDIQVVTGANTISADLTQIQDKTSTAAAPTVAIDVKALGGMYANNIYLVGTEKGLGVNNAGTLQAVNNLVVTSAGKIEHTGSISSTSKTQGLVSVSTTGTGTAADINSAGTISSFGLLSLDSGNDINIKAKDVTLNYEGVASSPLIISAKGNVNLADSAKIRNMGATGDLYIDATNINLAANAELRSNRGSAHIQAQKDFTSNKAGLVAAKDLTVSANNHLNLTDTRLHASTGNIQLQSSSKETALNKITVQGGSVSAAKELAIYADKDVILNNIDFVKKTNSTLAQINSLNVYAGGNLSFTTANQLFPYTAGKIQLGAGNALTVQGTGTRSTLKGGGGLSLSGKSVTTKNIQLAGSSANDLDIVSNGGNILLDQGTGLWANTGNINVNASNGSITANSLQATTLGKASLLASKNVILAANKVETVVTGTDAKNVTYTPSKITAEKGIQIASIDNGYLRLNTINLDAKNGDIQLDAKGNISLVRSDVITQQQKADGSFSPNKTYLWSELNGKNILINGGANNSLNWGNLNATGNIQAQAKGTQFLYGMNLKSGANTTLHADGRQTLHHVTAQSAGHTALSTKDRLHLSSSIVVADGTTNWGVGNTVKLQADGVLSLVSGAGQYLQNTDIKGGAVLIESGAGFDVNKNVKVTATGSPLLNNDKDLNKLNGNLSIQTNNNLTIDPKLLTLSAVGDYDLMSENGDLKLIGYGETKGSGSEQVVKLNTANGGISLAGKSVELQGTRLNATKDISIISNGGGLILDSVENKLIKDINDLHARKDYLDQEYAALLNDENYKRMMYLVNHNYTTKNGVIGALNEIKLLVEKLNERYQITVTPYGDGFTTKSDFSTGTRYYADVTVAQPYTQESDNTKQTITTLSKNLTGYGSEQVVKLDTTTGGIKLVGQKVELQGTQLTAAKDISIVSNGGDLIVDGVRNTLINQPSTKHINDLNTRKIYLDQEYAALINDENYKRMMYLVNHNYTTKNGVIGALNEIKLLVGKLNEKYQITVTPYGDGLTTKYSASTGTRYYTDVTVAQPYTQESDDTKQTIAILSKNLNGYEHQGATLTSNTGNINLISKQGLSISGSTIDAKKGSVLLEAAGTLADEEYLIQGEFKSNIKNSVKQGKIKGSIIIDATQDSYEIGQVTNDNYNWRSPVNATTINGDKGVTIKATGKSATDNLILQGVGITSNNGNVDIEAYKNIIFDVAVENSYDKSKKTETKRKWYGKKKTTTTIKTAERVGGVSVDIDAKNINVKSGEPKKADDKETGPHRTSIDMYSSQLTAHGGKVTILAGGDINLLTADNISNNTLDISKSSSWIGIKLNKSKYTSTRNIKSELPAVLEASYIGAQADGNIVLKGTEFNYLEGADIKAGQEIYLLGASELVEETLNKTSNSVVWQSMQDQGSITETSKLPTFNGPVAPKFEAKGGLTVQVPVVSGKDNDVRAEVLKLANQPGNAYLKDLVNRKDVNWEAVKLAQESWDYKSQGLTGAGAALIVIIVTIATMGTGTAAAAGAAGGAAAGGTTVGLGASMIGAAGITTTTVAGVTTVSVSALGAMANAAVTSLLTQASISTINNGGDLSQTLKDLGSKDSVKSLATSVVTAGLLHGVATNLNISSNAAINDVANRMANGMIQGVGSTLIDSTVNGTSLSEGLEKALLSGLANSLQAPLAGTIGDTLGMSNNAFVSKVVAIAAHAAAGCATGLVDKECQSRALGAALGEVIAENMFKPANGVEYTAAEEQKILNISKLTTGIVAAYTGNDVTAAANAAETAVKNNYLSHAQEKLKKQELNNCNVVTCGGLIVKWAAIDAGQDASYAAGFAAGIPVSVVESVVGLVQMALSPIETYKALKDVISSENALGKISNAIKEDLTNKINKAEAEYQKAGPSGSYNAGLETGKLVTDVVSIFAGGAGAVKGGAILTEKVAAKVSYKVLKDPVIISDKGVPVSLDGHKIYDPNFAPLSTNPKAQYRFSDFNHRPTGGDVYFGENIVTSYFEVRQAVNGKSLFVGQVEVKNVLDLTDPKILKQMGIDQKKLTEIAPDGMTKSELARKDAIYAYTNSIANQAYDKGYSGIIYNSSRNTGSNNNRAVVLFGDRYDPAKIKPVLDKPILTK
ncbi:filamentous hemagglutinin N-terminal domain-containing protein [Acinetobacter sp. 2JN-4]|uniref:two-partner secretion domain-containing protein n=1 Tax=Acinetobacter sp. 2JN-4 TaxID=2479844 RepID=UPI000EF9E1A5|nr:DUF637 domain-containing protein [Acinetobacter sp. 2JN-4]RLZ08822.1 filamentous hemagglutinin N-terminal domain-containing protein [Acinetobacter sp. 2JN-4]